MADEQSQHQRPQGTSNDQFYAIQEADMRTELEIEDSLLKTTGRIYLDTPENAKLAVIGALEQANNFLLKYQDTIPSNMLSELAVNIMTIRSSEFDTESLNEMYQPIRNQIMYILGIVLGFRKQKRPKYKWTEKLAERAQIEMTPKLQHFLGKKPAG
jgi:hypothetical protein